MLKRKSVIVYFRNPKALKFIEKVSPITYFTKKNKYAVLYMNEEEINEKLKLLKDIKLVRKVEESMIETQEYHMEF